MSKLEIPSGNNLLEYAIPMVVFSLAGIGITLSGVPESMVTYFIDSVNGVRTGNTVSVAAYGTLEKLPLSYSFAEAEMASEAEEKELSFDLSDYPVDLLLTIETAGGNGTTKILLATLEQYIADEIDEGSLTEEESQILIQLANQGHKMAQIEKLVEDRYHNSAGYEEFIKPIVYDGVLYPNPKELLDATIGWVGDDGHSDKMVANDEMLEPNITQINPAVLEIGKETQEFAKIYQEAKANGRLTDPTTDLVVTALAKQISLISGTVQQFTASILHREENQTPTGYANTFDQVAASEVTDINSVGICAVDNGEDSGIKCKKN